MAIHYPLRVVGDSTFVHILDQSGRAIAGGLLPEDAEEIVNVLNSQQLGSPALTTALRHKCTDECDPDKRLLRDAKDYVERQRAKRKSKRESQAEALRRSDLTAQLAERDNIEYSPSDSIPGGEHIIRLGAAKKSVS